MELYLRSLDCGPCPYLEDRQWQIEEFSAERLAPSIYEALLAEGFRRSGSSFYRNRCPGCELCVPIRLDAQSFRPSRSQRRLARVNSDLAFSQARSSFERGRFELYRRYAQARHGDGQAPEEAMESYRQFLLQDPLDAGLITEFRLPDGSLVANGYLDILPGGLSSVYFAFEPDHSRRSLGTWSVLRELEYAASLGKRWYYLGFWVPGSGKMDYKARFTPFEFARDGVWRRADSRAEALEALGVA
jgi:arginine-tRNA-protein transferase